MGSLAELVLTYRHESGGPKPVAFSDWRSVTDHRRCSDFLVHVHILKRANVPFWHLADIRLRSANVVAGPMSFFIGYSTKGQLFVIAKSSEIFP
jgi:hypothetical protein